MTPQQFLSALGIPYAGKTMAEINQLVSDAPIVAAAVKGGTYTKPVGNFNQFDLVTIQARYAATEGYRAAVMSGNIPAAHAAVDRGADVGGVSNLEPDILILSHAPTTAGSLAEAVLATKENGVDPIMLHPEYFDPIFTEYQTQPPPPPPAPTITMVAPNLPIPSGTVIQFADGTKWTYAVTPFGNYWVLPTK